MDLMINFWQLLVTAAPWLLFGFAIAGLIHAFVPIGFMNKYLGADGLATTVKAALIGAPLPLCSCGVIPAALGLRRSGASKSATVSFLVATPETGVDSVFVSYALLGPIMAVVRPIAAISSAIAAGVLVGREGKRPMPRDDGDTAKSCASKKNAKPVTTSCCSKKTSGKIAISDCNAPEPSALSFAEKLVSAFQFSTGKLVADTAQWLVIGLFFAALVQTFVPTDFFVSYGDGILAMTLMLLVSIPMYICATASTPIAAGLLFAGVSPGAVLVFMLAGPATNIATLGVVGKELGKRSLIAYLIGVVVTAMMFGVALDFGLDYFSVNISEGIEQHSHFMPDVVSQPLAWVLVVLMGRAFFKKVRDRFFATEARTLAKEKNS